MAPSLARALPALLALTLLGGLVAQEPTPTGAPPNILLIVADDLGYGDLGCMGSQFIATPHIDRLATSGVLCSRAYVASPVCSPSRAGMLTGRDPRRFGYQDNLNAASENYATRPELLGLPPSEHTLGDQLRAAGYATALVGKWHLGTSEGFHPNARGFDLFSGTLKGSHGYFPGRGGRASSIERNGTPVTEFQKPYLTDFFTDEIERFMRARHSAAADAPWFAMASYNAPHTPMQATEADRKACAHIKDQKRRRYAAMMRALDRGVGRLLDVLDELGERDNTLVVFVSDNGGATNNASWNGPLSGAKGSLKEGGIRVPMIWSWPARLPQGQRYDGVVSALDLVPTFVATSGGKLLPLKDRPSHESDRSRRQYARQFGASGGGSYDGIDILPALAGKVAAPSRTLFWRLQGQAAVLHGEDKLIRPPHRPAQLFRPGQDIAEVTDQAGSEPERLSELFALLATWEARLPTVPLWGSAPHWSANSAKIYDTWPPRPEPKDELPE